jgi:hypothetical protein
MQSSRALRLGLLSPPLCERRVTRVGTLNPRRAGRIELQAEENKVMEMINWLCSTDVVGERKEN